MDLLKDDTIIYKKSENNNDQNTLKNYDISMKNFLNEKQIINGENNFCNEMNNPECQYNNK